jgi:GntR family transcriptional regulator
LEASGLITTRRGSGTYVADRPVPYSEAERRRILSERLDGLIVESRNLGFGPEEVVDLLRERDGVLRVCYGVEVQREDAEHGES